MSTFLLKTNQLPSSTVYKISHTGVKCDLQFVVPRALGDFSAIKKCMTVFVVPQSSDNQVFERI